ncbi:hypothetical protein C0992_011917 [Termitomyces sp. T32_za158]|nr:hypothetical protein C0992_011917 [Termitomyces sp. T32_za158]
MTTVRRSIGSFPKKRGPESSKASAYGMISTPAERSLPTSTRYRDSAASRPTIEQIAMGLHTSRTPHLRPLNAGLPPVPQSRRVLPPPPARPSLKQTSSSPATLADDVPTSASSSTLASTSLSSKVLTPPMSSIKVRMARFLPRTRISSAPPSVLSSSAPSPRASTEIQMPKKAVRFSVSSEV